VISHNSALCCFLWRQTRLPQHSSLLPGPSAGRKNGSIGSRSIGTRGELTDGNRDCEVSSYYARSSLASSYLHGVIMSPEQGAVLPTRLGRSNQEVQMKPRNFGLCPQCTLCPEVQITDEGVRIGEDG